MESRIKAFGQSRVKSRDSTIFPDVFHCQADMPSGLDDRARIGNIGYSEINEKEREGHDIGERVQSERGKES